MHNIDIKNLTGKCLISMPTTDDHFAGTVVYVCSHKDNEGAMGFIVNKRVKDFSFQDLTSELPWNFGDVPPPISLYDGGPLERSKGFILHSDEYCPTESLNTGGGIAVSSSLSVLHDIAIGQGPKQRIIALGYAGWAPKQLETEIANNLWLVAESSPELIFGGNDETKWQRAIASLGIDFYNLAPNYGHS